MKIQDVDAEFIAVLERIREDLQGIEVLGSEFFYLIKHPLNGMVRYRKDHGNSVRTVLSSARALVSLLAFMARRWVARAQRDAALRLDSEFIFAVDHAHAKDIDFQERILAHFDPAAVTIVTDNPLVEKRLNDRYAGRVQRAYSMTDSVRLSRGDLLLWLKAVYRVRRGGVFVLPHIALSILKAILYLRLYEAVLDPSRIRAVVTYSDAHLHEHALTLAAARRGVATYTNQHGTIGYLYLPVVSDRIFVWGDIFRAQLCRLGVPDRKVVAVGRVGHPAARLRGAAAKRQGLCAAHGFAPARLTVAYFATDHGDYENHEWFRVFRSVLALPVNVLVRPRPNASRSAFEQFARWLKAVEGSIKAKVAVSNAEPYTEVLEQVDVVVTSHSGSVLDAMPYAVVGVIIDIFDALELPANLPYYDDMIVCKDAESLCATVAALENDRAALARLKAQALDNCGKYFKLSTSASPDRRIAEHILATRITGCARTP